MMPAVVSTPTLSTRELDTILRTEPRRLSPALDPDAPPVAIVELKGKRSVEDPARVHAGVGTVLVGVGDSADPGAVMCDVVLRRKDPRLDDVLRAVQHHPVPASTLVGVLRGSEDRSIEDGLLLESAAYSALQGGEEHQVWRVRRPRRDVPLADGPPVFLAREGDRLRVTLHRPERHNAFSAAMRDGLLQALDVALADASVQVELEGEGPSFCSGGDLDEFGTAADPALAHLVRTQASAARAMATLADRTTVNLHGACMGAGIELPAFAGHVTCAPDARLALPELQLGLIPGAGGTVSLPRRIGRQRTALLALSGQPIDAATALEWGLVDQLTD
jgi:enoyl-CoA hydratase/isomerase-like protein